MGNKFVKVSKFKTGDSTSDDEQMIATAGIWSKLMGYFAKEDLVGALESDAGKSLSDAAKRTIGDELVTGQKPLGKWSPISKLGRGVGNAIARFNPEEYKKILSTSLDCSYTDRKTGEIVLDNISLGDYLNSLRGPRNAIKPVDFVGNTDNAKVIDWIKKYNANKAKAEILARPIPWLAKGTGAYELLHNKDSITNPGNMSNPYNSGLLPDVYEGGSSSSPSPISSSSSSVVGSPSISHDSEDFMPFKKDDLLSLLSKSTPVASVNNKFTKIAIGEESVAEGQTPALDQPEGATEAQPAQPEEVDSTEIVKNLSLTAQQIPNPDVIENIIATAMQQGDQANIERYLNEHLFMPYGKVIDQISNTLGMMSGGEIT
jgi:hypothetical protein